MSDNDTNSNDQPTPSPSGVSAETKFFALLSAAVVIVVIAAVAVVLVATHHSNSHRQTAAATTTSSKKSSTASSTSSTPSSSTAIPKPKPETAAQKKEIAAHYKLVTGPYTASQVQQIAYREGFKPYFGVSATAPGITMRIDKSFLTATHEFAILYMDATARKSFAEQSYTDYPFSVLVETQIITNAKTWKAFQNQTKKSGFTAVPEKNGLIAELPPKKDTQVSQMIVYSPSQRLVGTVIMRDHPNAAQQRVLASQVTLH